MMNPFHTPFAAVFCNEVRLNTRRVAPYALMPLFIANAVLWWGWGPAVERGWATNSDFYIHRNYGGFAFLLGLPIFNAVIMGDPVLRDLRLNVYPLIFSKPVGRGSFLLGKFFGAFFVLVCCQSTFAITLFVLQWVPFSGMVTLPVRVVPFVKHFFFVVVISHLVLAVFYFAAGTLTRNAKIVYAMAALFYPVYIGAELLLVKDLPTGVRVFLEPFAFFFNADSDFDAWHRSADFINQYVIHYGPAVYVNRAWMIVVTGLVLWTVYWRFTIEEGKTSDEMTVLNLSRPSERVAYFVDAAPASYRVFGSAQLDKRERPTLPQITATHSRVPKLLAALGVEFRLLRAERSLIVLVPLAVVISIFDLAFYRVVPEISYSVTYATGTANAPLLFLIGMIVFYTGEVMHRDRELRIEPVLWSMPVSNGVLLLSKWLGTVLLTLSLILLFALTAIVVQLVRGHTPVAVPAYLLTYGVIVLPNIVFVTALVVALNIVLRHKYLAYVVEIGTVATLFYLYTHGHNHWLYNPLLYRLWRYSDLTSAKILTQRLYCVALSAACLASGYVFFRRYRGRS
jgi:ABC-type transport system involved in multi-copper enzyme maturation permease subunit